MLKIAWRKNYSSKKKFVFPPPPEFFFYTNFLFFLNVGNSMKREENMKFKKKNSNFIFLNI